MTTSILDGKAAAASIREELRRETSALAAAGKRTPHLTAILVGSDGASQTYVGAKDKACAELGFGSEVIRMPESTTQEELLAVIEKINNDPTRDGLIVQLPLPKHIDEVVITDAVAPDKDVDGFNTISAGKLAKGMDGFISATPYGILMLLKHFNVETAGKHCVVIGRSNIVGRPMSILMSRNDNPGNCTVTLCHSRTPDLAAECRRADILIAALGKPEFVKADMVKEGAVVVDVGITRLADPGSPKGYRITGDVDFKEVAPKCSWITPVPGGVGVMTIAGLLLNTMKAYRLHENGASASH